MLNLKRWIRNISGCSSGDSGETTLEKAKEDLRFHMMIAESSHHLLIISFSQLFLYPLF